MALESAINSFRSVFHSDNERAAWLLLCAWLCYLEDNVFGSTCCLFYACQAIGVPW